MRVFAASLGTETNTFSPIPTGADAFNAHGYFPAGKHPDHLLFFAAPLWVARQVCAVEGWTLIEGLVAGAQPGGVTTRKVYEALRDELLDDLSSALPVQMVLLGLHGAMVAEGYHDCEGDLLRRVREIAGPDVVIGVELDPHNHLTAETACNCKILKEDGALLLVAEFMVKDEAPRVNRTDRERLPLHEDANKAMASPAPISSAMFFATPAREGRSADVH
jgi:microcystin degradation protein MlrC